MNENDAGQACPGCAAPLSPPDAGIRTRVCPSCRALVDLSRPKAGPKVVRQQQAKDVEGFAAAPLQVGMRGELLGRSLEIVGVLERRDGDARWFEYALREADGEFAWLFVFGGHTSLTVRGAPNVVSGGVDGWKFRGRMLRPYQAGRPRFVAALGEFPMRIDTGMSEVCHDYIAPPYLASREHGTWTVFEYVEPATVAAAFGAKPWFAHGLGINQPSGVQMQQRALGTVLVVALLALFFLHVWTSVRTTTAPLARGELTVADAEQGSTSFGPFTLERPWNALKLKTYAPVRNAWVDVELGLVNEDTGRTYWTTRGVEAYDGHDSDGYWSEGSPSESGVLRAIPGGRYTVVAKASGGTWMEGRVPPYARIEVYAVGSPLGNLVLAVLALLAFPAVILYFGHTFEIRRWTDSPYDPYAKDDDE